MSHTRTMRVATLTFVLVAACLSPVRAQLSADVNAALARAVDRVLESQRADGSFGFLGGRQGATAGYPVGGTALATYALRKSGLQPGHPAMQAAAGYLMARPLEKTYSVSALVLALHALGQPENEGRILEAAAWLVEHQDERTGLWAYPHGEVDLSNTQFAVLALKAAAQHGHETPSRLWAEVIEGTLAHQRKDGGFFYRNNYWPEPSGSMTTAGLTTLYVALEFLEAAGQAPAQQAVARDGIESAWAWMDARFSASGGPMGHAGVIKDRYPEFGRSDHHHYYYLYGVERVATFAGRETVGGLPWYRTVALEVLGAESADGGWGKLETTCLAMLVLRRATISGSMPAGVEPLGVGASGTVPAAGAGATPAADRDPAGDGAVWAYTTEEPHKKWLQSGYDDRRWARGTGGFGGGGAAGLVVRTPWETPDLWVRRSFQWAPAEGESRLFVIHDDAVQIWINGEPAAAGATWSGGRYVEFALSSAARRSLRKGENLIAAHVHDSGGGCSLDIRFSPLEEPPPMSSAWLRSLPRADVPFVRRWELLGPIDDEDHEALLDRSMPSAIGRGAKLGKRSWTTERTLGNRLRLDQSVGGGPGTTAYVSVWLHAEAGTEAWLWLGLADGVRGWLDGQPLLLHHEHGVARPDELRVPLTLRAGAQRLVLLLEQWGSESALNARVAGWDGAPIDGLRYALSGEAPDAARIAWAQPGLFDLAGLSRLLPMAGGSALRFDRQDDLDLVAFAGESAEWPRWFARTSDAEGEPRPPSGARGVLALWPPAPDRAARLFVRTTLGARTRSLDAVVGLAEGATSGGRLRLLLQSPLPAPDGTLHTLVEADLVPGASKGRSGYQRLTAEVPESAGQDVLLVVEWSASSGGVSQPLFVDELSVR